MTKNSNLTPHTQWLAALLAFYLVFSFCIDSTGIPAISNALSLMDWQRVFELTTLVSCLFLCIFDKNISDRSFRFSSWQVYGWGIFFLLNACSDFFSTFPHFALVEWSRTLISLLLFTYVSLHAESNPQGISKVIGLYVWIVLALYTPAFYLSNCLSIFDARDSDWFYFVGFNNARVFSDYQAALSFLLPWALRHLQISNFMRPFAWALACAYLSPAFATGSRSQLLGLIIVMAAIMPLFSRAFLIQYTKQMLRLWIGAFFIYILIFHLLPFLFSDIMPTVLERGIRYGSSGRIELWQMAFQMARENPWLGVGHLHFATKINSIAASPHNQFMQIMAESGFPALIISTSLVLIWFFGIFRILASKKREMEHHDWFEASLFCSFLVLIVHSCVSPVFNNPQTSVLLILLGGTLTGVLGFRSPGKTVLLSMKIPAYISLLAVLILVLTVTPWVSHLGERNACHFSQVPFSPPRFWQQGWLYEACEPALLRKFSFSNSISP